MTMTRIKVELIKQKIAEKGLTRAKAAEQAGISPATLSKILATGTSGAINIGKLARLIGVKAWELVD